MNGLLLVNKPKGITSFDVIRKLRHILKDPSTGSGFRGKPLKIGHAGTLDPLATGLMLMLFGTACKQASEFSKLDKTYMAEITLGANSTTGDAEGELLPVSDRQPTLEEVRSAIGKFVGEITQAPSIYSAIKVAGKEAYKYARAGEAVEVPSRKVTIYSIELISYEYPKISIKADVSSGTYIRSLGEDIGMQLETGAYLSQLERTRVGNYSLSDAIGVESSPQQIELAIISIDKK